VSQLILWPHQIWPQDIGAGVQDGSSLLDTRGRLRIAAPLSPTFVINGSVV
jgi:hypothetical protein